MSSKNTYQILSYLPLEKFHIIPIYGLSPSNLKDSAKNASRDREKISHTSLLNACAKSFGARGGFAGYQQEYENKLLPFMCKHKLTKYQNLVTPHDFSSLKLNRQDISERLFYSNKNFPKKIFTGYNFPYHGPFESGSMLTAVLYGFNLIGDQLVKPRKNEYYELQLYFDNNLNETYKNEKMSLYKGHLKNFLERIEKIDKGWVDVIQYNENLIFLKGENGAYDFLVRNQRDKTFSHQPYEPYLKRADIPNFDDSYHFNRWYYFEYKGFRQEVLHKAETQFYANGGDSSNYPGEEALLKTILSEGFAKKYKRYVSNKKIEGFSEVLLKDGKKLMISELVTIKEFELFKNENNDYFDKRNTLLSYLEKGHLDDLNPMNEESNKDFPVTITFYDALKYIDWFNEKHKIETRLLSYDEYIEISPFEFKDFKEIGNDDSILFFDKNNNPMQDVPYMKEEDFQKLKVKFNNPSFKNKNGINFINSNRFAEWIKEKTCIRSNSLSSFYGDHLTLRCTPPLTSTGKYKYIKIGFRLCYEYE